MFKRACPVLFLTCLIAPPNCLVCPLTSPSRMEERVQSPPNVFDTLEYFLERFTGISRSPRVTVDSRTIFLAASKWICAQIALGQPNL